MTAPATVEAYFAALPEQSRAPLEALRQAIRSAAPGATETISYQMPTMKLGGRLLVSYAAFRHHYSLFPASQAVREALGEALAPYLAGKGTIRFRWNEPLPDGLVAGIVRARIEEITERGQRAGS